MSDDPNIAKLRWIDDPHEWDAEPGFRTRDLTNDEAWDAMQRAADVVVLNALGGRRLLLELGFSVMHSLCRELDDTARQYSDIYEAVRRQRRPPKEEAGE